jgi:hypothetical protein
MFGSARWWAVLVLGKGDEEVTRGALAREPRGCSTPPAVAGLIGRPTDSRARPRPEHRHPARVAIAITALRSLLDDVTDLDQRLHVGVIRYVSHDCRGVWAEGCPKSLG